MKWQRAVLSYAAPGTRFGQVDLQGSGSHSLVVVRCACITILMTTSFFCGESQGNTVLLAKALCWRIYVVSIAIRELYHDGQAIFLFWLGLGLCKDPMEVSVPSRFS